MYICSSVGFAIFAVKVGKVEPVWGKVADDIFGFS
jgi:hypothetical protein